MKRIIPLALALSACAHKPVATPCLTRAQYDELAKQEPPKVGEQLTGHAGKDVKTIAGSAIRLRAWGQGLLGVLDGCSR